VATIDDFHALDLRVGEIVRVEPFPNARKPAWKLWVDFGPELGLKQSSAQVVARYGPAQLMHRKVVAVVNFPPRQIADFMSEVLVLGADDAEGRVALLRPDSDTPLGAKIY
jgi:tRNA-binding protein